MSKIPFDRERDRRISEIIADSYEPEEQALGWYYYLERRLHFPFLADHVTRRNTPPFQAHEEVKVVEMAPEEECEHEMFVLIAWDDDEFPVPLANLEPINADEQTRQA